MTLSTRGAGSPELQHGFPLNEARRRNADCRILLQVDFLPRTPVAVGIVHVAAAGKEFDIAGAAKFGASPAGKNVGIKDIALVSAFGFGGRAPAETFAQVAGRGVQAAVRSVGESRDLGCAGFEQVGEFVFAADGKNVSAVSGAGQQTATLIKGEGIDDVFVRTPQAAGRAVGGDAINLRAAGRPPRREQGS